MIPGRASAAFTPHRPDRDAKALSLFLIHSFRPFSSLGGSSPSPPDVVAPTTTPTPTPHQAIMIQQVPLWPSR